MKEIRAFIVQKDESGADYHRQQKGHWIVDSPISNPMSIYDKYKQSRTSWGIDALGWCILSVHLKIQER